MTGGRRPDIPILNSRLQRSEIVVGLTAFSTAAILNIVDEVMNDIVPGRNFGVDCSLRLDAVSQAS